MDLVFPCVMGCFGSFVQVLAVVLLECVFGHMHATCFGSTSFACWPV